MRRLFPLLALILLALAQAAGAQTTPPHATKGPASALPALRLFEIARSIELDDSEGQVLEVLGAAPWLSVDEPQSLPNGVSRVVVAIPEDDDCLPRGASLACPTIRVVLVNDPMRGPRVSRIEAFDLLPGGPSVAQIFRNAALGLGAPLQTESWSDQIRGLPRSIWRQRWRPDARENTYLEVVVTSDQAEDDAPGLASPASPAVGVGFVLVDPAIEDSTLMARRRLICPPGRADCG